MSKIYDFTPSYSFAKRYVNFTFKRYYSDYIVIGKENIPENDPVIFAPNHINALMDALAVLAAVPFKMPIVFLARADIFNNKTAAKILRFTKIMPAFRMRDGMENLGRNNEIFERCVEVLDNKKVLGIMPEGNQGYERKIRPLVKGIFRIAFAAQQKYGYQSGVKIIPVGIDLGDYVKARKHIIVNFGKSIEISEYMNSFNENQVNATNDLKFRLKSDLSNLTMDLSTEKYYDCFEIITQIAANTLPKESKVENPIVDRFKIRQKTAKQLVELELSQPEKIELLDKLCSEYKSGLNNLRLKDSILNSGETGKSKLFAEGIYLLVSSLIYLYGLILNFLPFFSPVFIRKHIFKAKDHGFFSSLHFALAIFTFPVFYILQTYVFYLLFNSIWWLTIIFFLSQYFAGKFALNWNSKFKKYKAKLRFNTLLNNNDNALLKAIKIRKKIIEQIS